MLFGNQLKFMSEHPYGWRVYGESNAHKNYAQTYETH